ncbi:MAG TPA: phosphatidate cytidylyltransferase [Pirellulales bacterium]|nr:phosphatidate cytidylyltransferase [Pirellulales bacterium]
MDSSIFRIYTAILLSLLVFAGGCLAFVRWGRRTNVDHAWRAYRGWLIMTPTAVLCLFLGRFVSIGFFTILSLLGFREYARATGLARDRWMSGAVYLAIISIGVISAMPDPTTGARGWYGLFIAEPVFVVAILMLIPILRNRASEQLQNLALAIMGFIYIGWMFGHLSFMTNATNAYGYLFYILFAVELNDVAAFTFGKLFGRHPLRSNISPKKTWEGALGALSVSMLLPWILHFSFDYFQPLQCVLTGLIVGIGGQLGDLSISVIKRDVGVKDMGSSIRGHGGFLDRIDSLIYAAPLFFHMAGYYFWMQ